MKKYIIQKAIISFSISFGISFGVIFAFMASSFILPHAQNAFNKTFSFKSEVVQVNQKVAPQSIKCPGKRILFLAMTAEDRLLYIQKKNAAHNYMKQLNAQAKTNLTVYMQIPKPVQENNLHANFVMKKPCPFKNINKYTPQGGFI